MSGISGIILKNSKNKNYFKKTIYDMGKLIRHRGPYKQGFLEFENTFLSHVNMLSTDTRDIAREPMSVDNRYSIMLDGSIYNFEEIKNTLIKKNFKFFTKTHTEVAINAFKDNGLESFNYFNGDWVICILDKFEKKIIIAKDALGTKPFYINTQNNFISFCSEIKGFRAHGSIEFNYNNLGLNQLTIYNFNDTKFENIKQINPGSYVEINIEKLTIEETKWFSPLKNLFPIHPNYEVNKNELKDRIFNSIKARTVSDKKIGTSLSGGLDSAVIFTLMNEIENEAKLKSNFYLNPFIVNYDNILTLELAKKITDLHNRRLEIINSEPSNEPESLSNIFSQLEIVEEYKKQIDLYKNYKKHEVDISIDGHGIEYFLGSPLDFLQFSFTYFNNIVDLNKTNISLSNDSVIKNTKKFFGALIDNYSYAEIDLSNFVNRKNFFSDYLHSQNNYYLDKKLNDLKEDFKLVVENFNIDFQYSFFKSHYGSLQFFQHKWDKASLFSSVEMRRPYLDKNVCYYILSLPLDKKIKNGSYKSIFKEAYKDKIPDYIINQKFKQGLPISTVNDLKSKKSLIDQMLNEADFNNFNWDSKKIKKDFIQSKNLDIIWEIVKFYLMQKGFDNMYSNIPEDMKFGTVPIIKE